MREVTYRIPDESADVITELVQQLGGSVESVINSEEAPISKKTSAKKKRVEKPVDHTFLFGKWKDFDIDARKLRDDLWNRKF